MLLNALMTQPVSLSSWGQFDVGRFPVELGAHDCGIVQTERGKEYLSVFAVGSETRESRVCADRNLNEIEADIGKLLERRLRSDMAVLADMGVDVECIDWNSAGDSDNDRARWRKAILFGGGR